VTTVRGWITLLMLVGAGLEVVGIAVVGIDLKRTRNDIVQFRHRPMTIHPPVATARAMGTFQPL
jgi:hypothetical protein